MIPAGTLLEKEEGSDPRITPSGNAYIPPSTALQVLDWGVRCSVRPPRSLSSYEGPSRENTGVLQYCVTSATQGPGGGVGGTEPHHSELRGQRKRSGGSDAWTGRLRGFAYRSGATGRAAWSERSPEGRTEAQLAVPDSFALILQGDDSENTAGLHACSHSRKGATKLWGAGVGASPLSP